ncbi:cell migration-inducing and hyaluronan-binding protein-like [Branchiostoma floridae x Branchiostoma belcheri]
MDKRTLKHKLHRGHYVFILNERTGAVLGKATIDTYWGGGGTAAARRLTTYLQGVEEGRIIVIAVQDTGDTNVDLSPYGSTIQPGYRESWAMITQKGMIPSWFVEKKSAKGAGPTVVQAYIQVDDESEPAVNHYLTLKTSATPDHPGSHDSLTVEIFSDVCDDVCMTKTVSGLTKGG